MIVAILALAQEPAIEASGTTLTLTGDEVLVASGGQSAASVATALDVQRLAERIEELARDTRTNTTEAAERLEGTQGALDNYVAAIGANFSGLDRQLEGVETSLGSLDGRVAALESAMQLPPPPSCPPLPPLAKGTSFGGGRAVGSTVLHRCDPGYELRGGEPLQVCSTAAGAPQWHPAASPRCEAAVTCRVAIDNWVRRWYVDGEAKPLDRASSWKAVHTIEFPHTTRVFGIFGADREAGCAKGGLVFHCTCTDDTSPWHNLMSVPDAGGTLGYSSRDGDAIPDASGWATPDFAAAAAGFKPVRQSAHSGCPAILLSPCARSDGACDTDGTCQPREDATVCPQEPAQWALDYEETALVKTTYSWYRIAP